MKLIDSYDGSNRPFEGDKSLTWMSLPAGAVVRKATLTLTPVSASGVDLFREEIGFSGAQGDWGATMASDQTTFVEIDFHKRRTLVKVNHNGLTGASLQVDMGGVYVEINDKGAITSAANDNPFSLPQDGTLPGLTASKFRLTLGAAGSPGISAVFVRSVPANITARLGKMAPFWPRIGDLTRTDTSPDFADVLRSFLTQTQAANGYYVIPLIIHSDTLARVQASLEVDFLQQASMMPDGVDQVILPFDYSSVPGTDPKVLTVKLPFNAQVVPDATTAKVTGVFDDTRVVHGDTGFISATAAVTVTSNDSCAEWFALDAPASIVSVDLLIAPLPPGAILAIDFRGDLDGKPDSTSLLPAPAQATVPSRSDGQPVWINISLSSALPLQGSTNDPPKYWIVVQSLQGQANWSVQPQSDGTVVMQHSDDSGLSWRESAVPGVTAPAALFRLRTKPAQFQMPIEAQVGAGPDGTRISLDKFQPSGRVNFDLSFPEFAQGFNQFLQNMTSGRCSPGEHLLNATLEQWVLTGNTPGRVEAVSEFPSGFDTVALAFTSDGETAYAVLNDDGGHAQLLTIDVACNRVTGQPLDLPARLGPQQLRIYPDGTKAFVVGTQLVLIDLEHLRILGSASSQVADLVFSPDGANVYLLTLSTAGISVSSLALLALETALFANALTSAQVLDLGGAVITGTPVAFAVDKTNLYILSKAGSPVTGTVTFLDPQTRARKGNPVTRVGSLAMAVSPDGTFLLVAGTDGNLSIIHTDARDITPLPLSVPAVPSKAAVAIDPTGKFAYVASSAAGSGITIDVVDLLHRNVAQTITVPGKAQVFSMALTPQGDELYLGEDQVGELQYLPIGLRSPADWFVTSGTIMLTCMPEISSAHIVAFLQGASLAGKGAQPLPAAMSQVTPVTGGCNFEFSFEGLSNDPNAIAEILWRTSNCQSSRTDTVPIPRSPSTTSAVVGHETAFTAPSRLIPSRVRLTAPQDATAAEVRFVVPDQTAKIALPSLSGSPQNLQNGTLQLTQPQTPTPDGWSLSPANASGFVVDSSSPRALLRNTGTATGDLVQSVSVGAQQEFTLNFLGQATSSKRAANPQIQVRWLDGQGKTVGTTISQDILPDTFDSHPVQGQIPAGATQAEVHLSLPSGTSLQVDEISLQVQNLLAVPVTFISKAPGQLRVTGAQVSYERSTPVPPAVPASGLCPPTPPGEPPSQQPFGSSQCQCSCCASKSTMADATPTITPGGRPMNVGVCSNCGNQMMQGGGSGGPGVALRTRLAAHRTPFAGSAVLTSSPFATAIRLVRLTDVTGIGSARADQLKLAGIQTAQDLAAADKQIVFNALKGVSIANAQVLIENAKSLVSEI